MKKILLVVVVAILFSRENVSAQITIDHVYNSNAPISAFKLSSGLKYFAQHDTTSPIPTTLYFVLYNPDHSIFRTINVPQLPNKRANNISFVSDALFDTDTLIEYMLYYQDNINTSLFSVCVQNELGNVLLYVDTMNFTGNVGDDEYRGYKGMPIFPDGNQTKLYLYNLYTKTTTVYNLPGRLACLECAEGFVIGIAQPPGLLSEENQSLAYPNPSNDYIKIKYSLPPGFKQAFVNLYDISGKLIKQKEIDGQYDDIYLSTEEIRQGAYSYAIVVDGKRMTSGKIIKL